MLSTLMIIEDPFHRAMGSADRLERKLMAHLYLSQYIRIFFKFYCLLLCSTKQN